MGSGSGALTSICPVPYRFGRPLALLPILLLFAAMYLLVIRPQQKRIREHQAVVASLRPGDEVVTAGGIFGTITALDDQAVSLDVAPGVTLRVLRPSISRRVSDEPQLEEGLAGDIDGDIDELDTELRALEEPTVEPPSLPPDPTPPPPARPPEAGPDASDRPVNDGGNQPGRGAS